VGGLSGCVSIAIPSASVTHQRTTQQCSAVSTAVRGKTTDPVEQIRSQIEEQARQRHKIDVMLYSINTAS
jgi:hypothetical protein